MKLYIDLKKAIGQSPNVGRVTEREDQSTVEHDSSYAHRYEGVASGESLDPDDPNEGGKWPHDEDDTVVEEVKSDRKKREKEGEDGGVVKSAAVQKLELINKALQAEKHVRTPNPREQEFLREVLGYSQEDINKGVALITGRNRSLFNRWLCDRLTHSTETLVKSVGVSFD